jgi:hypothetical protein
MESSTRDSDYVTLVCTPKYAKKANERSGGVGYETSVVTGELYNQTKSAKVESDG